MSELVREELINEIFDRLSNLISIVAIKNTVNLTDTNVHAETFYAGLLNRIYGFNLRNVNEEHQNAEGIDLVDTDKKILIQVTSTCTKGKIDHSLAEIDKSYSKYQFYFLPLVARAKSQKKNTYSPPFDIKFNPETDILDLSALMKKLTNEQDDTKIRDVYEFVKRNIKSVTDEDSKLVSGLDYVIKQLSIGELESVDFDLTDFQIDAKIQFNGLQYGKDIIDEYVSYYGNVQRIYDEYSHQGLNKSAAVLQKLHKIYLLNKQSLTGDELFLKMESEVKSSIGVKNLPAGTSEELLDMCVDILLVHAFMECKIFEKPITD